MTIDAFDKMEFRGTDVVVYDGKYYPLMSVDFEERLMAINMSNTEDLRWVRCENVKILKTVADG